MDAAELGLGGAPAGVEPAIGLLGQFKGLFHGDDGGFEAAGDGAEHRAASVLDEARHIVVAARDVPLVRIGDVHQDFLGRIRFFHQRQVAVADIGKETVRQRGAAGQEAEELDVFRAGQRMAFQVLVDDGRRDAQVAELLQVRWLRGGHGIGQYQVRPELQDGLVIQCGVIAHIDGMGPYLRVRHIGQARHGRRHGIAPQRVQETDIGRGHAHDAPNGRIDFNRIWCAAVWRHDDGLILLQVEPLRVLHPAAFGRWPGRPAGHGLPR